MIVVYTIAGLIVAHVLIFFIYAITACNPIRYVLVHPGLDEPRAEPQLTSHHARYLWFPPFNQGDHCRSPAANNTMMKAHAITGIILDLALLVTTIWVLYDKMIFNKRAIQVMMVFSVGIFAIVTGIVRLYLMCTLDFTTDS